MPDWDDRRTDASSNDGAAKTVALLDWRRRIADLYYEIRHTPDPRAEWSAWQITRARLFREHSQSPVPVTQRHRYEGPSYFPYHSAWRVKATIEPDSPQRHQTTTSTGESIGLRRWGRAQFSQAGADLALELYWLEGYAGGLFLPFADATSGRETYGAGRYLLDTAKGADLGQDGDRLILDFNFAYQPSCSYDPEWSCPLAPAANRLAVAVRAGERTGYRGDRDIAGVTGSAPRSRA